MPRGVYPKRKPKGLKMLRAGNDPDCVHYEQIDGDIGTCVRCGQVRKYPDYGKYSEEKPNPFPRKRDASNIMPFM
jgi:hypothetical protein